MSHFKSLLQTILLSTSALLFSVSASAQIGVGPIEQVKMKAGDFDMMDLKKLEKSETIFFYRPDDDVEELKRAISDIWTVSPISFKPYSKLKNQDMDGKSVLSLGGFNTTVTNQGSGMSTNHIHVYLSLWMMGKNKRGKPEKKHFGRIDFHPSGDFYGKILKYDSEGALDYIYNEAILRNWHPGFLRNQLQVVNNYLSKNSERWLYENEEKNPEVKKLAKNTLYVVDYAMMDFNKFNGDESKRHDEEKLFKNYPYKYELISASDLSEKILNSTEPFYYMVYLKSSTDKYLTVYNSETGEIVYTKYTPMSYVLKDKDLKDLAKSID